MIATEARLRLRNTHGRTRAYAALLLGAVCIGFSAIFTKWAAVPGPVSGFYRVGIATLVLAVPFAVSDARLRARARDGVPGAGGALLRRSLVGLAALAGLFFALDLGFWNTSLEYTSAANSTLIANMATVWVAIGATLLFREKLSRRFLVGMLLALAGVVVIMGRDVVEHPRLGWGDVLAIAASMFYAAYLLNTQRARRNLGTLSFMWLSSVVASVLLLVYCLAMGMAIAGFKAETWLALIGLGVISHVTGWLAINYALGHLPASISSVTLLSQPVVTALAAVPLLHESLSIFQVAGGLLVLLGIYIVNRRQG